MGNLFVGKVLRSIAARPAAKPVETELVPIRPGAWAAWAKADGEQATTAVGEKAEGRAPGLAPATPRR